MVTTAVTWTTSMACRVLFCPFGAGILQPPFTFIVRKRTDQIKLFLCFFFTQDRQLLYMGLENMRVSNNDSTFILGGAIPLTCVCVRLPGARAVDRRPRQPSPSAYASSRMLLFFPFLLSWRIACISDGWRQRGGEGWAHETAIKPLWPPTPPQVAVSAVKRRTGCKQVCAGGYDMMCFSFLSDIKPATLIGQIPLLCTSMTSDNPRQPFKSATLPVCTDNRGYPGKQGMSEHRGAVTTLQTHA